MKAQYLIELDKALKQTTSVGWKTEPGSATPGVDYVHAEGVLVFAPGETSKLINIEIVERPSATESRVFYVRIDNASGLLIGNEIGACVIPAGASTLGPLIRNGLVGNSYHDVLGRDGYFHANSGTSEGQAVAIEAAFLAYEALNISDPQPAGEYLAMALKMLDAMGDGSRRGAMLRQPFPTSSGTITLMHWLFAARGDIPAQSIVYDQLATAVSGKLTIPRRGADVFKVWMIYPATSHLLYQSPYSPAYDNTNPAGETQRPVAATDWRVVGESVEITAPVTGSWYIVYGLNNSGVIAQGEAQEAYPCWTKIADGYAACAPDTFRWLDLAPCIGLFTISDLFYRYICCPSACH
uniref:Calx-beta domain-containing protein n=1 Tax=Pseudomonas sp. TaxID=306 RepID=UPI00258B53D1